MRQRLWPQGDGLPPPEVLQRVHTLSAVIELAHQPNPDFAWSFFFGWPDEYILLFPWVAGNLAEEQGAPDMSTPRPTTGVVRAPRGQENSGAPLRFLERQGGRQRVGGAGAAGH